MKDEARRGLTGAAFGALLLSACATHPRHSRVTSDFDLGVANCEFAPYGSNSPNSSAEVKIRRTTTGSKVEYYLAFRLEYASSSNQNGNTDPKPLILIVNGEKIPLGNVPDNREDRPSRKTGDSNHVLIAHQPLSTPVIQKLKNARRVSFKLLFAGKVGGELSFSKENLARLKRVPM